MPDIKLGGEHMKIVENPDGSATITFDDVGTGRKCSECSLCCKLIPVPPLMKKAGERCKHQKTGKGCTIYEHRPFACRTWSCRWLADPTTAGMQRPDRVHYVIDLEYDYVSFLNHATGERRNIQVLQVWVDPAFREAHRDPGLRRYMNKLGESRIATLVRWNSSDAITIFPPSMTPSREWVEHRDGKVVKREVLRREVTLAVEQEGIHAAD